MESSNDVDLGHIFNNLSGAREGSVIITLALLRSIVSGFFGRGVVKVCGMQSNSLVSCAGNHLNRYYVSLRFSSGINRKVNHILNNKVYFSTSCINLGNSNGCLKSAEVVYSNSDLNKKQIIEENKKKSGVYRWTNLKTGFSYVGSSVNLSKRFMNYFNFSFQAF